MARSSQWIDSSSPRATRNRRGASSGGSTPASTSLGIASATSGFMGNLSPILSQPAGAFWLFLPLRPPPGEAEIASGIMDHRLTPEEKHRLYQSHAPEALAAIERVLAAPG